MSDPVTILSSMATRAFLADVAAMLARGSDPRIEVVSVGGVDAAKRVRAREPFDIVVLAGKPMADLAGEGYVDAASLTGIVRSGMAAAVPAGRPHHPLTNADAVAAALRDAEAIAYSTGPSGDHLLRLVERFGLTSALSGRLVQAKPGVPVAALLASGEADLGFQQLSEFVGAPGIDILGPLPAEVQSTTVFTAGLCRAARAPEAARAVIAALASPELAALKNRHGLDPA